MIKRSPNLNKELMIGDYVYYADDCINNRVVRVTSLFSSDTRLNVMDLDNKEYSLALFYYIKPIPITSEILIKNGFSQESDMLCVYKLKLDDSWISYNLDGIFSYDGWSKSNEKIYGIHYVHELQHILKLRKIDKEIIL